MRTKYDKSIYTDTYYFDERVASASIIMSMSLYLNQRSNNHKTKLEQNNRHTFRHFHIDSSSALYFMIVLMQRITFFYCIQSIKTFNNTRSYCMFS